MPEALEFRLRFPNCVCHTPKVYRSIQYLRAVAAIAVVAKHAFHPPHERVLGYGVDLFFVISGFVMVASTPGRATTWSGFLTRRAQRILPMWWLTLAIVFVFGLQRPGSGPYDLLLSFALIPSIVADGFGGLVWGVGWTLAFEMLFYLSFALLLAIGRLAWLPVMLAAFVVYGLVFGRPAVPLLNDLTHPIILEFIFGFAIAKFTLAGGRWPVWLVPLGTVLFVALSWHWGTGELRPLIAGLPLAMVVAGSVGLEVRGRLPESRALEFLGDASYSIYLLHYAVIILLLGLVPGPLLFIGGIGMGALAYWLVERPLLKLLRGRRKIPASAW